VPHVHRYAAELAWRGSTAGGYRNYDRNHTVRTVPVEQPLPMTADPSFLGDASRHNPEQLLLAAASSCQLLSFLALAAVEGVDVLSYADRAEAEMAVTRGPMKISRIVLRPRVEVAAGVDPDRVRELLHRGHEQCYVANTLDTEMVLEPEVVVGS
jgi:organic hydroperoxide reductase OsmC/OhrA